MASWAEQLQRELAGRGLAVASVPAKGRGLVATRSFFPGINPALPLSPRTDDAVLQLRAKQGCRAAYNLLGGLWEWHSRDRLWHGKREVIISQEPYTSTPNKISVGSACDHCFSTGHLRKCSVCRVVWYCGSACQKEEWKLHQLECQAIAALTEDRKKMLTPTIRLMVQLVLKRKMQNEKVIPSSGIDNYSLVDGLESHISKVDENQLVLYAQMANLVNLILPSLELDLKEIAHTFSKFSCNAHTICDPELRPLGTGLFPIISIINHRCCIPNAVLIFDGRTAYVRALQPISKDEEISISYIETAAVTKKRQDDLKQYFFICTCLRCLKGAEEDALLEGYRCKNQTCDGFLCCMTQIYMELQDWQTALTFCRLTIPVYERVYPPFHPMIGLQFYTCGKLEWLLECTEDALKSLTRAADILRITHGTKSSS
ncbi:hypothetical protein PR202_ga13171 [Eleusine coracana subsp. coracana]|uniref:Uncharacterized protein n=1 Tax=Eleusine coracana subsp. coracana TaxID=191504 RepID=A0AAV5CE52_ELECO|nr:hypothetical protein PR202_ga13171 [Eleusine coracana subsp. coracana]